MNKIRIAIVDDHAVLRNGVACILRNQPDLAVVAEAENGLIAIEMVDRLLPDVVLMDLNMPVMDGYAATKIIKAKHPQVKVIVLSMHNDDGVRARALEAGACHFLSKDCTPAGIVAAIRHCRDTSPRT